MTLADIEIGVLDYGVGNLTSVANALAAAGAAATRVEDPDTARRCTGLLLPGVGAFGEGMARLKASGLDRVVLDHAGAGRPLLGICLGMQLLFEESEEHGRHAGLGLFRGRVRRLAPPADAPRVRVPHMGWNRVAQPRPSALFGAIPDGEAFYFVHSFVAEPEEPDLAVGLCEHGERFVCAVERGAVSAAQFHPEKSHRAGLALLSNFVARVRAC